MAFGFRKYSGKAIEVKKEQLVIKNILKLRMEGLSYREVADRLNKLKLKTKTGTNFWYPKVVRQIATRNTQVSLVV